jgi:membrane protease YdiL (CAAX protease family)
VSRSVFAGPLLDVTLMTVVLFSFIWLWRDSFPGHFHVCIALCLGIGAWSHRRWKESAAEIGIRADNLAQSLLFGLRFVVPMALVAIALGAWLDTLEPPRVRSMGSLVRKWFWSTMQQYVLACFYYRRLRDVLGSHWRAALAAAGLFGLAHLPNPFLTPVTFATGIVACVIYRRAPNLFGLGILHALLSIALRLSFGPDITHGMRVGPGYWRYTVE